MPISFDLNEIPNREIRQAVEKVIRECIGDRPEEEDWRVSVKVGSDYCQVTAEGPQPTPQRDFFDDFHALPEKIRTWLESYPFR